MSRIPLSARIVAGFTLGIVLGTCLGHDAVAIGEFGKAIIGLVRALAGPLLFFAIVRSVIEAPLTGGQARILAGVTTINAFFAIVIGLGISTIFEPGHALSELAKSATSGDAIKAWKPPEWSFDAWVKTLAPKSILEPFIENAVLSLAIAGIAIGLATRKVLSSMPEEERARSEATAKSVVTLGHSVFEKLLTWAVELAPIAVMAVVASSVGDKGLGALLGLWAYLVAGISGLALQVLIVYQAWIWWSGIPLKTFWAIARGPVVYSVGVNSSLATLPLTVKALDELKVSRSASTLGACIGTNLNNDGILLYEAMAVLFVAQAYGIHLALGTKLLMIGLCWLATVGIGGVPEAGFVSLSIILSQVGLPTELLSFLLSVDWVLARLRSVVNVLADMTTSIAIDHRLKAIGDPERR